MRGAALVLALVALGLAGCGGDDEPEPGSAPESAAPPASAGAGGDTVVEMTDQLTFEPQEIEVSVGDEVSWENVGKMGHTVTADKSKAADPSLVSIPEGTKPWDSGMVTEGESFSRKFDEPGTYRYFCIPHEGAGMTGTVVVK